MLLALLMSTSTACSLAQTRPQESPETSGDSIRSSLTDVAGDAVRGRALVLDRQTSLCLLCHSGPFPEERFQGNLAPDLAGAGSRWSEGQLRLRLVDTRRLNPASIMPSYYRTDGLVRVGGNWQSRPILTAQQIEDVIAFLQTLKN
ncbi:MAG: sulfur oxidation c-type cytochrome SoxX [Pseudomonadota bacterium]